MRLRRNPVSPAADEGWSEGFELSLDEGEHDTPPGPVSLCLDCGALSPTRGECPHDEVARVESPGPSLLAAARALVSAQQARRSAERSLRRAVEGEVLRGGATVERRAAPAPPETALVLGAKRRRRRGAMEGQGVFAFASEEVNDAPTQADAPRELER